ncbi:phytanoyl-CoA dioxygenase family protein [Microcoleus sp. FACHB-831]|uniref:phytanoyl-CoA dioxygenase family protein n=1 Tax=Microcoleus sp. FACHB-831 TaxID=2692827 RepID=UPI001681F67E|nr:phytanoyl-CoA dioxygenase family protein [Microcoleus sp. FACHB-831]MBD1924171.1 phytanoyl-CoA dioxygenase family protein [Microcoleus sp. FACHB-831]
MIILPEKTALTSLGYELDCSSDAFGALTDSSDLLNEPDKLRLRMQEEGYLYLRALINPEEVWRSRQEIAELLAADGCLEPGFPLLDCVAKPGLKMSFRPDLATESQALKNLLYTGRMMEFYQKFLGGNVRNFDFTWLRAVAPGIGTYPHCDIVYMGRGTHELYTTWTPLGDVSLEMGGLMILENSHRLESIKNGYGRKDVDSYCANHNTAQLYARGEKWWNGALSKNPVSLRKKYGGRWLTTNFKAGDVLIFGMFTIHGSLDNHSEQIRLSSDSRYQLSSQPIDERWVGVNPIAHSSAGKRGRIC